MSVMVYEEDIPEGLELVGDIAVDTETMGLVPQRDRLCLVQLKDESGQVALVRFAANVSFNAPNLKRLLSNPQQTKIFHFARFDVAAIHQWLNVWVHPIFCTKIASKLVRTYTNRHGLKDLCSELLGVEISKQEQTSDWGAHALSEAQLKYATNDVLYLHQLREKLEAMLKRENRKQMAYKLFEAIQVRAQLDLTGWGDEDIFAH
ncbi:MAG: ribonuclease D [Alphaproteobacteria bacterium]|nr:ribonuclease D [Alphaproteobacteria bacterium]OJV46482.1 MAG: ribonuclease D [Alphaproteobacteria bacterium 43-37]